MWLLSCAGTRPATLGIKDGRLAPCPSTPNCVSSDAATAPHAIAALELIVQRGHAWRALHGELENLPRVKIVTAADDYVYAECSSALFGFVDDLELHIRPAQNIIAVRSAARLGYGDFGVNRRRIETLRSSLRQRGIVR